MQKCRSRYEMKASEKYLKHLESLIDDLAKDQTGCIEDAAQLIANSIRNNGVIHAFGSGHSHMLAEELFYRAGGLVQVNPILDERLMLHKSASQSTGYERQAGLAKEILKSHEIRGNDTFIIASNSGGNAVVEEMATYLIQIGIPVIAITSLKHATDSSARTNGRKLHEIATVVIDNLGIPGDASLLVNSIYVGPTSSVIGCAIVNAISSRAVEILGEDGIIPKVFMSSNTEIGDQRNQELLTEFSRKIRSL